MMDVGEHIQAETMSLIVHNFDDQSPIKITRKDVEEKTKINANALTINSDFNLSPPRKRFLYIVYMSILPEIDDEWMPRSLFDQIDQYVKKNSNSE